MHVKSNIQNQEKERISCEIDDFIRHLCFEAAYMHTFDTSIARTTAAHMGFKWPHEGLWLSFAGGKRDFDCAITRLLLLLLDLKPFRRLKRYKIVDGGDGNDPYRVGHREQPATWVCWAGR